MNFEILAEKMRTVRDRLSIESELLRRQAIPIVGSLVFLLVGVSMLSLNFAHFRHEPFKERLKDLGHELVPEIERPWLKNLPLWFIISEAVAVLVFNVPYAVNAARRFLTAYAFGHLLRTISFIGTSIPGGHERCFDDFRTTFEIRFASFEENCGDLMFSGHVMLSTLLTLIVYRYYPRRDLLALNYVAIVAQGVLIIASRRHYTTDVIVAFYVTHLMWYRHEGQFPHDMVINGEESKTHEDEKEYLT